MVRVRKPSGKDAQVRDDDQDRRRREVPPLRAEAPAPEETEAFRKETFERYHEVLTELADS
ncbi:MAG: hypothetical protein OXI56_08870 [bacterium]|nr:hypothetical protein [bacterium]MDE0601889.1 hypothetical protein [bacterium]